MTVEAFLVLVPFVPRHTNAVAKIDSSYRYCVTVRSKRNGEVILFEPASLSSYVVPPAHLRPPTAYPRELRPAWVARTIRRRLKDFNRWGRRADRTTAAELMKALDLSGAGSGPDDV